MLSGWHTLFHTSVYLLWYTEAALVAITMHTQLCNHHAIIYQTANYFDCNKMGACTLQYIQMSKIHKRGAPYRNKDASIRTYTAQ